MLLLNPTTKMKKVKLFNIMIQLSNDVTFKSNDEDEKGKIIQYKEAYYYVAEHSYDFKDKIGQYFPENSPVLTEIPITANLDGIEDIKNIAMNNIVTTYVTNMDSLFIDKATFNQDISSWDTSSVTNMEYMFDNAVEFNQDISNWNTSNVINMSGMFDKAVEFNQNISNWDTSKVTTMDFMFFNATSFNQDISNWDISSVANMEYMFNGATQFNQKLNWNLNENVNMNSWNTGSGASLLLKISFASGTGDPYIYPLYGTFYKLPNRCGFYRLFKHNETIINGQVDSFNVEDISNNSMNYFPKDLTNILSNNGNCETMYFFRYIYIHHKDKSTIYDLINMSFSNYCFQYETSSRINEICKVYKNEKNHTCTIKLGNIMIHLCKYNNPQVITGIDLTVSSDCSNARGLLVRDQCSKSQMIKKLNSHKDTIEQKKTGKMINETFTRKHGDKLRTTRMCIKVL